MGGHRPGDGWMNWVRRLVEAEGDSNLGQIDGRTQLQKLMCRLWFQAELI